MQSQPTSTADMQTPPLAIQSIATRFRWFGWGSFWLQLAIALVSVAILVLAAFSRSIDSDTNLAATGLSVFFAVAALITLGFNTALSYRLTRLGKRLVSPVAEVKLSKPDTIRLLRVGLLVSLLGLVLSAMGSEISVVTLLAKSLAQPQGTAIYQPDKIIRVLDIFIVLANVNLVFAHLVSNATCQWLTKQLDD